MKEESVWRGRVDLDDVNRFVQGSMIEHVGIEFTEVGPDFLTGTMPVDHRTKQPFGILHGGASVVLAETLGSMAANMCVDREKELCVGLDIAANHVRQVVSGTVIGTARALHIGRRTHIWEIRIENESSELVSVSRLTMIVLQRSQDQDR